MKQFLITAYDYTDDGALERRMNIRPHHLDGARALKASGNFIIGGAMVDEEGKMIGSTMVLQFNDEEELLAWQKSEPYITQKIWESVDIKPFRVADV
ncbi:YciI family protein [Mucilaginibacter antarcticus]|uniref:YciI family protein n=1 Tax=Mucilaginibacter antarcticus TaxID=1855725 RepID=A0ABW5XJZ6_9SPHI